MIIRSEHSFGPGKADTAITAKWVAQIESDAAQAADAADGDAAQSGKCPINENNAGEDTVGGLDGLVGSVAAAVGGTP